MTEITREFTDILRQRMSQEFPLMQVVLGPRQVGKTTGVKQLLSTWEGSKLMETADLLSPPSNDWIGLQWERARAMPEPVLLVLDEVQKVPNWSEAVKLYFDQDRNERDIRVIILGSASLSIQEGLTESLAGRFELIPVYHWSLAEMEQAFAFDLNHYLLFGGYPSAARYLDDLPRWLSFLKESIIEPVLSRDIQGSRRIQKPALFRQSFELVMHYPAQEVSLQKLLGQLQDRGNVTTIKHYIDLFEQAFLIRSLQKYSAKPIQTRGSSPKFLPLAPALVNAFLGLNSLDDKEELRGRMFELAVGARLNQLGSLYYWREGKYELDFVLKVYQELYAIEVKSGRKRKISGLSKFLEKFPNAKPLIITPDNFQSEPLLS